MSSLPLNHMGCLVLSIARTAIAAQIEQHRAAEALEASEEGPGAEADEVLSLMCHLFSKMHFLHFIFIFFMQSPGDFGYGAGAGAGAFNFF